MDPPAAEQASAAAEGSKAASVAGDSTKDEGYCTKLDIEDDSAPATNRTDGSTNRTNCTADVVVRSDDEEVRTYVEGALKALNQSNEPSALSAYEKLQLHELHEKIDLFSHNTMALLSWIEEYIELQDNKFTAVSSPSEMQDRSNRVAVHAERLYNDVKRDGPLLLANLKKGEGETIKTIIEKVETKYRKMQSGYYDKVDLPHRDPPITPPPAPVKSAPSLSRARAKRSQELDRFDVWEEFMEEYYKMIEWTELIKKRIDAAVTVITGSRFVFQDIEEELSEYSGKRTHFRTLANCVAEFYPSLTVETRELQREVDTTCDRLIVDVRAEMANLRSYSNYVSRVAEFEETYEVLSRRYHLVPRPLPSTALVPYYDIPPPPPRPLPYYDPLDHYSLYRLNALERDAIRRDMLMLYDIKNRSCGGEMSDFSFHQIRDKLGFKNLRPKPLTSTPKKDGGRPSAPSPRPSEKSDKGSSKDAASNKDTSSTSPAEEPEAEEPAAEEPAAEEPASEDPASEEPAAEEPAADESIKEEAVEEPAKEESEPAATSEPTEAPAAEPAPVEEEKVDEVIPTIPRQTPCSSYRFLNLDDVDAPNISQVPTIIIEFHKMLKHCEEQCYTKMAEVPMGWDPTHLRKLLAMNSDCQRTLNGKRHDLSVINAASKKKYRYKMNEEKDVALKWCVTMLDQRYNNLVLHCIDTQLILERRMDAIMKRGGASGRLIHPTSGLWTEKREDMRCIPTGYDSDYILPTYY